MHFEHATKTVTFGLLLKSFNVAINLICTVSDIIFIFRIRVPYDKAFLMVSLSDFHCDFDLIL